MLAAAAPTPEMSPQPGCASWKSTTALSSSAMLTMLVPSTVIGDVVPVSGMGRISTGTPALTSCHRRLGHLALVLERGDGAVDRAEDGPVPERAAGHRLEDLQQRLHVRHLADLVLHVLAEAVQRDRLDLEAGRQRIEVAGRDRRPRVVHLGERVEQAHHLPQRVRRSLRCGLR